MKGIELYSWREGDSNRWHFSLLEGTNRLKTYEEITAFSIIGILKLRRAISRLDTKYIVWKDLSNGSEERNYILEFELPPLQAMKSLKRYCDLLGIELLTP